MTVLLTPEITGSTAYYMEVRDRGGRRLAYVPYMNIQQDDLLNKSGNMRFAIDRNDPKSTRYYFEEATREIWLYRQDKLIFAGPIWQIASQSENESIEITCNGLLSYFWFRIYDEDRLFATDSSGGEIAQYVLNYTQSKPFGDLRVTYGSYVTTDMGYKVSSLKRDRKKVLTFITELSDNEVTGFDFEITPQRVWNAYVQKGSTQPGLLEYTQGGDGNITRYAVTRFGSTIMNDIGARSEGGNEAVLIGYASDDVSKARYGLMEGTIEDTGAKTVAGLETKAAFHLQEKKTALSTPQLTIHGKRLDFLNTYKTGDTVRVRIDNGYDQYDKDTRITGWQLTVGSNDQESVNVYLDVDDEGADGTVVE